jgi:hypothetical protein
MGTGLIVFPACIGSIRKARPSQQAVGGIDQYREVSIVQRNSIRANGIEWSELGVCSVCEQCVQAGKEHQPQKMCHKCFSLELSAT